MTTTNPSRKSSRIPGFDYTSPGFYFVTICAYHHNCIFGKVVNGEMISNEIGNAVNRAWHTLANRESEIKLHDYVLMPNHLHGIIEILPNAEAPLSRHIASLKSQVTKSLPKPHGQLWQRSFYDHIIRNQDDYSRIAEYIANNPLKWEFDKYHRDLL